MSIKREVKGDNSKKANVLFFETYSVVQIFFLIKYIRKAEIIYIHKKNQPLLKQNPFIKKIVEKIIYLVNKNCRIETLPTEKIKEYNWIMNKKAIVFVDESSSDIVNNSVYRTILNIIHDENILKSYKADIVDGIAASLLFFRIAKDLVSERGSSIYIIPAGNNHVKFQKFLFGEMLLNSHVLRIGIAANQVRYFFFKVFAIALFILLPTVYVLLKMKKITFRKINKKHYDIAMPVMYGFHDGEIMIDGVRRIQTDDYLYNSHITPGRIIHIFSIWRNSPDVDDGYRRVMDKRDIPHMDIKDYRITPKLLFFVAKIQFKVIVYSLFNLFYIRDRYDYIWFSNKIMYGMFNKYLEFGNVDYKVELVRDDYSPNHIVGTIICNQNNKKTVGIQHHINAFDFPKLSFVHFDKYIVFGEILVNTYMPHWGCLNLQKTGRNSIDWVVNFSKDKGKIRKIQDSIKDRYGLRKYIVLIILPLGSSQKNEEKKWDEVYEGLKEITGLDLDMHFFLRFRSVNELDTYPHLQRFRELVQSDRRFILDHENFTTYELMAVSDLVIASSSSFSIFETVAINKKVFVFDFIGVSKYYFSDYGRDLILRNSNDIIKVFKGLKTNFVDFECNWEKLRKDCNYHYDGRNLERIQKVVFDTIREVESSHQRNQVPQSSLKEDRIHV